MYNVLIVDDESIICDGLCEIIDWNKYNFNVVGVARNGKEAIQKVKSNKLDLVITDVRMPAMDGIELCKQIKEYDPSIERIIISGYSDFDYARGAIEHGVKAYLLKPIMPNELIEQLLYIRRELDRRLELEKEEKQKRKILKDKLLYELANGYFNHDQIEEDLEKYNINLDNKVYSIALIAIDNFSNILEKYIKNAKTLKKKLRGTIEEFVDSRELGHVYEEMDGMFGVLILSEPENYGSIDKLHTDLEAITSWVKKDLEIDVSIGCGTYKTELHKIKDSRQEALRALEVKLQNTKSLIERVIEYVDANYCEDISLSSIANLFYINPAYLGQLFKETTGILFSQYINQKRIKRAKELYIAGKFKMYEIIEMVGYKHSEYFYRQFKKYEGITFAQFRKKVENK